MKLTVLGGGGVRIPALVRAVVAGRPTAFDSIDLFEPDPVRRETLGRLSVELATALGRPGVVSVTDDVEEALTDTDYVFSAIRVGGDQGRIIDEQVALRRGVVGQETTGPGGGAMALRTIPVVLGYCETLARVAPDAVLINFTNPAGIITQAISSHSHVKAVGVCDTPSGTIRRIGEYLDVAPGRLGYSYGGLNHLGWISSIVVDGEERIDELLAHYELLAAFDHRFAAFDPALVRRVGAIPTEYVYYFYDPAAYVAGVARAGASRGQDVARFNEAVLTGIGRGFEGGDVHDAWASYSRVMGARRGSYMRIDVEGKGAYDGEAIASEREAEPLETSEGGIGGYEGIALSVIDGLSGARPGRVIVNVRNGSTQPFLDPDDVLETPSFVDPSGVRSLAGNPLTAPARGLVLQVKAYERAIVDAAVTGDAELAALALALHPLVPGLSVARELMADYREQHGATLAYLQ
jgi:6-phospho-beta-glucosidase